MPESFQGFSQLQPQALRKLPWFIYTIKTSQGTLDSSCHLTILLFCSGAHKPWLSFSYQWTMVIVKASMVHLQCIFVLETWNGKNAEAAENCHIFQFVSGFHCSVTDSRAALATHQAVTIKTRVCCVRVCKSSILACIMAAASIYKIVKSQCVP
jgi:hypothetical protein